MSILEERQFFLGENSDYEDRKMEPGDYRFGLNIEVDSVDGANQGIVTNSKGNRLVSAMLPSGTNTCIGQGQDEHDQYTYYFLHNTAGNHSIYRFNHLTEVIELVMENPMFNFSLDHRVNSVDIVDDKLLYFNDGFNPPRKINVNKATENGKLRKFNIYFGDKPQNGETYTIDVQFNGVSISFWTYTSPVVTNGSAYDLAHDLAAAAPPFALNLATYTSCGASVEVEFQNPGEYDLVVTSNVANQVIVTAENFYPKPYPEDFIDRLKYPLECEPSAEYKVDISISQNLVSDSVFQFAIQYVYDDNEKSAISPYSVIPTSASACGITGATSRYNYIEVDFTNARLNDPVRRSLIKLINIIYREGNTGELKLSSVLQRHQFGINKNIFKFYNNSTTSVIPFSDSSKLFDSLPIVSGTSEVISNRIFDSDIIEGYDQTCIDADLNVSYGNVGGYVDLKGVLSVIQFTNDDPLRWKRMPMNNINFGFLTGFWGWLKDTWASPFGGAFAFWNTGYQPLKADANLWNAPLGGFVVYLAGTDYQAITSQRIITHIPTSQPIVVQDQTTGLVNDWNNQTEYDIVRGVAAGNPAYSSSWLQDFTIPNVKPGVYSLRVAATNLGINDLYDPLKKYQRTSTTIQTDPFGGYTAGVCGTGRTEAIIEVLPNGDVNVRHPDTYAIISTSQTGDVGETFVRDYSDGAWGMFVAGGSVYLIDGGGNSVVTNSTLVRDNPSLSGISTQFKHTYVDQAIFTYPDRYDQAVSDHNGLVSSYSVFYEANNAPFYGPTARLSYLQIIRTRVPITGMAGLQVYDTTSAGDLIIVANNKVASYSYYFHGTASLRIDARTLVDGNVQDIFGTPVEGANVVITGHNSYPTDPLGNFSISYYATSWGVLPESANLLISTTGLCKMTAVVPRTPLSFIIGPGNYDEANHYNTGQYSVLFFSVEYSGLKRGWDGSFGIVYYDRGNRSDAVNTNESLNLHVPFYTEADPSGALHFRNTPIVTWNIRNSPPKWATHYQWVRTKNYQLSRYIQFLAEKVEYVNLPKSDTPTPNPIIPFSTARYARIDTSNLLTYKDYNADSLLGYTWEKGDRIRFISKPGNIFYQQYFDYEILSADGQFIFIYKDDYIGQIPNGVLFEIYTPKKSTEQKIFYEIGECFEVGLDSQGRVFHKGPDQDQDPSNPFAVPAIGTFSTGDAWYRDRLMSYNSNPGSVAAIQMIDASYISDFYESDDDNIGRPNIYDPNLKQIRREKSVRFSDVYLEDTQINGLSSNAALNVETIEKGEGPVYKLIRAGNVLLAIQGSQCSSLYVNEIIYIDANANPSLTASTKVIGTIRPLQGDFGTINPESVVEYEGNVYIFDQLGGNVIRYKQDGLNPISYLKMRSYFGAKAKEMAALAHNLTYAIGGFDPLNKRYLLTFKANSPRQSITFTQETKVFNELSNRWTSSQSFIPECYGQTSMNIISFNNGELWIHDSPVKNNFYGVQYNSKVGAVFNQESGKVRNFIGLSQESDGVWSVPEMRVPKNANAPSGMLSRLIKSKFVKKEGVWYGAIMKDMLSPNFATQTEALISGRAMRGHVLTMTLENDQDTEVKLNAINLKYIHSEPSKK